MVKSHSSIPCCFVLKFHSLVSSVFASRSCALQAVAVEFRSSATTTTQHAFDCLIRVLAPLLDVCTSHWPAPMSLQTAIGAFSSTSLASEHLRSMDGSGIARVAIDHCESWSFRGGSLLRHNQCSSRVWSG